MSDQPVDRFPTPPRTPKPGDLTVPTPTDVPIDTTSDGIEEHKSALYLDHPRGSVKLAHLDPILASGLSKGSTITGTAALLAARNPVLAVGQIGYETDTISFKIGDGSTAYNTLTYVYRGLPVASEPSAGNLHFTASTGVWPDINKAEVYTAPYTWDLSGAGGCPVGTRAVLIDAQLYFDTVAAVSTFAGMIWDFDFGAQNTNETIRRGLYLETSYKPATAGVEAIRVWKCRWVKIGTSRKLYVGLSIAGRAIAADYCGYC